MKSETLKWIVYNLVVCFAVYWLSNLVLWYPWSINEKLGQILMLTVNPLFWGFASYICIISYPKANSMNGVLLTSLIFVLEAIGSDFVFFVVIRNAINKLLQSTTFYSWGFVLLLPFIVYLLFRKRIKKNKKTVEISDFWKPLIIGLLSFVIIVIILVFNIIFE